MEHYACAECYWDGGAEEVIDSLDGYLCPECGGLLTEFEDEFEYQQFLVG